MTNRPPKWINRFLRWFCNPSLLDEIEGDVLELYERRSTKGRFIANIRYFRDVIGYLRIANLKKSPETNGSLKNVILLRNFLKIGFRNIIRRDFGVNAINIFGFAIALGICITSLIFYDVQVNMDQFHKKGDRIYQITQVTKDLKKLGKTLTTLGPNFKQDFSTIEDFVRIERRIAYVSHKKDVFEERVAFVDPSFMQLFDFPMVSGNRSSLSDKNSIVLGYEMAKKYFAGEDPIGKELQVKFSDDYTGLYIVKGVMEKYSDYASFYYDFYIPFENIFEAERGPINEQESTVDATFLFVKEEANLKDILDVFPRYLNEINENSDYAEIVDFKLYPLYDLSENCHDIAGSVSFTAPAFTRISLAVIGLMILSLAVFNFINITISSYSRRLREIAIRKVIGGNRAQIVLQFFIENILLCTFSLLLGLLLSYSFFTPGLNNLIPLRIPFSFSSYSFMLTGLSLLLLFIVVIAGIYPSFYIAKFQSSSILKGIVLFKRNGILSKVMLAGQFILAFICIVGCLVFTTHSYFIFEKDWGYKTENVLMVRTTSIDQAEQLKSLLSMQPQIEKIAMSQHSHIGVHNPVLQYKFNDQTYESVAFKVDHNYNSLLDLKLQEGRWFKNVKSDLENTVLVNQALVQEMGWKTPVNNQIEIEGKTKTVVGVVEDFHYRNFNSEIGPVLFQGMHEKNGSEFYYILLKVRQEELLNTQIAVREIWDKLAPDEPYVSLLQEDAFKTFYEEVKAENLILSVIGSISTILACLSLFGLFSFTIQRRIREFSIKKVLGASALSILKNASKSYLISILIALFIGAPFGYLMISKLLSVMYADPIDTGVYPFVFAFVVTIITISLTIFSQIKRVLKMNPTENLRSD